MATYIVNPGTPTIGTEPRKLVAFCDWASLLAYVDGPTPDMAHRWVWYQAPFDAWPRLVEVRRRFKNGKLRIKAGPLTFTADSGHLIRFRRFG
jgi:hypothetical protein